MAMTPDRRSSLADKGFPNAKQTASVGVAKDPNGCMHGPVGEA